MDEETWAEKDGGDRHVQGSRDQELSGNNRGAPRPRGRAAARDHRDGEEQEEEAEEKQGQVHKEIRSFEAIEELPTGGAAQDQGRQDSECDESSRGGEEDRQREGGDKEGEDGREDRPRAEFGSYEKIHESSKESFE